MKQGSFIEHIASFSIFKMWDYMSGTRAKPWDDRELDIFEGIKCFSFVFYTISQTACFLLYTWLNNLFTIFDMLTTVAINAFICTNIALEVFVMISAFFTVYRSFQIMEAKGSALSLKDILKIYARKFIRIAPVYYSMWFIIWALTSRVLFGPISYNGNIN